MPVQVRAEVLSLVPAGAYHALTLRGAGLTDGFAPGQFVAVAVGGPGSAMLLRRAFAVCGTGPDGVVELVFAVHGAGTGWLAERRAGDLLDVVGPLGTPFTVPGAPGAVALVGGGYGSGPLLPLAAALVDRHPVHLVVGAGGAHRLWGVREAEALGVTVTVTTDDGSAGERGRVSDVLPRVLASGCEAVYACGPMAMLAAVAQVAAAHGVPAQVAVEESMACGIGVCMTCVLPVVGGDGLTRMVRSCVEGPVFASDRVRWDAGGAVPAEAVGARS